MTFVLQIIFSIILGFLIGLEREKQGKSVGIRTVSLITLGSTLFTIMSPDTFGADNSRIIASIVSGVSFICIGVIVKEGCSVKGLTTSMTLWCSAAIGALCGLSMYFEAFVSTVAVISINLIFRYFKSVENDEGKICNGDSGMA